MLSMEKSVSAKKMEAGANSLLDTIFSWSVRDVLNRNLYKDKVKRIPQLFLSSDEYTKSFEAPLMEETRASLCSGMESVGLAPACEISELDFSKDHRPPKELYYNILTRRITGFKNPGGHYEPEVGDLIVLTKNTKPRKIDDLSRPGQQFVVALVASLEEGSDMTRILASKEIDSELRPSPFTRVRVFATYLMNMTTNMRIWKGLHPDPLGTNMKLILKVLRPESDAGEDCNICLSQANFMLMEENVLGMIASFELDESQKGAVLSSIAMRKCTHQQRNVKLIWGPPGTGKTKTVASLLLALLKLKCRTLACAPTNIAVLQVTKRLMKLLKGSLEYDTYGFGDIVLFGNGERMKVDEHDGLLDVFLDYRAEILAKCLSPLTGWKGTLCSMISLLEDPEKQYRLYLKNSGVIDGEEDEEGDESNDAESIESNQNDGKTDDDSPAKGKGKGKGLKRNNREFWKEVIGQSLKGTNKKKDGQNETSTDLVKGIDMQNHENNDKSKELMTFEEFVKKRFYSIAEHLSFFMKSLYTHLPTSVIELNVVKKMIRLLYLLKVLDDARGEPNHEHTLTMKRADFLDMLKTLPEQFQIPVLSSSDIQGIKNFCFMNADLIFCTASSSAKLLTEGMKPVEMVIVDEAAQLKECESMIPFQIPGLRNTILIGDDRQLPAMVQSKVADDAYFGRSLFERLSKLGQKKHLLKIQYRMHPSISSFPNTKFYEKRIIDAPEVKETSYERRFLEGEMYGSYSFIHVARGKEDFDKGHSPRNLVEAAVISQIIANLFKEYSVSKQKVSVGVVSPYKGQVGLIQETLGKKYSNYSENGFSVSVRSVDGFQGGEEDIIIISTVRSNGTGSVGFLANHQRTNVALTRARYCLWIIGNGTTLANSRSVWNDLVRDAQTRGCFYNAEEDKELEQAMATALVETTRSDATFNLESLRLALELRKARWKVVFTSGFKNSMSNIKCNETQKEVTGMLMKLAEGWRQPPVLDVVEATGVASTLLELYKVDEQLYLAWTVDILKEKAKYMQVIKVWDVLPASGIRKLAENLNILFGRYTLDTINRCKHTSFEGNLAVPMTWPVCSVSDLLMKMMMMMMVMMIAILQIICQAN